MNNKISVIIPTYNREKTILRAINSVLEQSYENLELLVVDDASTDNTEEVVRSVKDDRLHYHRLEKNGGAGQARNEGVKLASAELIAFQDSDDCWRPDKLEKQMAYWKEHPEYDMIYCPYLCHMEDGQEWEIPADTIGGNLEGDIFGDLLARNTIGAPTVLMRKKEFLSCRGFDASLRCLEDWEFAVRFAKEHLIGYVPVVLMDVYLTGEGVSSQKGAYYESRCRMIGQFQKELTDRGLFDTVVMDLFQRARKAGLLEQVQKMLLLFLNRAI